MEVLKFKKHGLYLDFGIDDKGHLLILAISDKKIENLPEKCEEFNALELFTSGSRATGNLGAKHSGGDELFYEEHSESDDQICFTLKNEMVRAKLVYDFWENTKTVRVHSEITNVSGENVGIAYVSSFCLYKIDPDSIFIPHSGWCREMLWRKYTPEELGLVKTNIFSTKRITASNTGTWSCKEYLPMGMVENSEQTIFWQIESNGSWNWEISDIEDALYLKLSGPSEQENMWWKNLKPNETFVSVSTAVSVVSGDFSDAVSQMTAYRRHIAYRSPADINLPVIFNDYMGCIWAEPTTEKELPVIDAAAAAGAEVYCMDAGWYADGTWWDTVGEWKVCEKRFRNGMKEVFDYIRSKNMIAGIWLEPESMGINCPLADEWDDSCFFMSHGKRVINRGRYQLDFRSKKVTDFLDGIIDGLIADYGIGYFKFDYNIDAGAGTEVDSDSLGDGLIKYNDAFLKWIDRIYERHPKLIIENCGSGGLRMNYKMLSHFSLQSLTDTENCIDTAPIAAMSQTAVIPEQAAVWCIPKKSDTLGEIAVNAVNAMFKRIHLSGETAELDSKQLEILYEGIEFYKSIRERIPKMSAFYPIGLIDFNREWSVVGYTDGEKTYLCVTRILGKDEITIPLKLKADEAEVVYPKSSEAHIELSGNIITAALPEKSAVILEIR